MQLSAMDDNGKPVDWWFAYKVAGKAQASQTSKTKATLPDGGGAVKGTEYVYFDANSPQDGKLTLSSCRVDKNGALPNTLNQLYGEQGLSTQHLGWIFYNDENPINKVVNGQRGHTKGVLAFELGTNTGFWLIQSTPLFPLQGKYGFPDTGMPNAQTLLCITLSSADVARQIAAQMFAAQQPNVYLASQIPVDLENSPNDPRVLLMKDQIISGNTPVTSVIPFTSKGGVKFSSIAKNKYWGLDFYNDLVGPTLHENLDVETWGHAAVPGSLDSDKIHTVVDMTGIDLTPLGYNIYWPESNDHAKLAISARSESTHFICVGDINFTVPMEKRSGGTVAFQCEPLYTSLSSTLVGVTTHLKPGSKMEKLQTARRSASATAAAASPKAKGATPKKAAAKK
jgi:deoxyribonuclease-2